jgi:hypothetical protein
MTDEYTQKLLGYIASEKRRRPILKMPAEDNFRLFAQAIGAGAQTIEADALATQIIIQTIHADKPKDRSAIKRKLATEAVTNQPDVFIDLMQTLILITRNTNYLRRALPAGEEEPINVILNLFNEVHPPVQFLGEENPNKNSTII